MRTPTVSDIYRETLPAYLEDSELTVASLKDFTFIFGTESSITHVEQGYDMADFDVVVFTSVGKHAERAVAAAYYLSGRGVKFIDAYLHRPGNGKLAGSAVRAANGLPVPKTVYTAQNSSDVIVGQLGMPFIFKADRGRKGQNNYLIRTDEEFQNAIQQSDIDMVAQEYIKTDGDYRILVMGGQVSLVIKRTIVGDSHLSNTSQGGQAEIVAPTSLNDGILHDAIRATQLEELDVAGVDIIISEETGQHYILEVNRAPQLASGSFISEKMQAYAQFLNRLV